MYRTEEGNRQCLWHFYVRFLKLPDTWRLLTSEQAYENWRRQVKFNSWSLPSCSDGSNKGDCCREGPHVLVSKTGYAKKLTPYCGPTAPKFEKSDFENGKARWLVVFNNTNNGGEFKPELELESPTIGYRSNESIM